MTAWRALDAILQAMDLSEIGQGLRAIRYHLGFTQTEIAERAGVSQSVYSRAERGLLDGVTLGTLDRIATAIDAGVVIDLQYRGGLVDRLVDAAHASLVEFVVDFLKARGWTVEIEFTFNVYGERGSVDVLGWHPTSRSLLIIEVKSRFTDLQAMLLSLSRKLRLIPGVARDELDWDALAVARIVVAYGTAENRAVIRRHQAIFDTSFPASAPEVRAWLRAPEASIAGIWLVSDGVLPHPRIVRR